MRKNKQANDGVFVEIEYVLIQRASFRGREEKNGKFFTHRERERWNESVDIWQINFILKRFNAFFYENLFFLFVAQKES